MSADTRNVIDRYKHWDIDLIKADLETKKFPYAVAMQHVGGDFNLSSVWRNANAFGAQEVFYIGGKRKIDIRGAVGVQHYTPIKHLPTIDDLKPLKERYIFIGIENNVDGAVKLSTFTWPFDKPVLMLFGEEGRGLLPEVLSMCDHIVYVEQFGSVRSINVSSCSAVLMNDFITKYNNRT